MTSEPTDPISVAKELVPLLREEAPRAEETRTLTPRTLEAVVDSGLLPLVTPRRFGGRGAGLAALAQVTRELGHGCPAAAWTISFFMLHNWLVGKFPDELGARVFEDRPYAFVPAPLAPTGTIESADGDFVLSGRWE
ncbi:MAG: acyl-CoA dehydrogenase family protein, partial [Actinomycetota bacterium]